MTGILMAIKMFKAQPPQIWQGILTIICWIFGVIYGWQKKDELGLGVLPLIYTICGIGSIVINVIARSAAAAG